MLKNIKDMGWTIPSGLVYTEEGNSVKITIPNDATIGTKYTIKYSNNSCSKSVTVTVGGNINCNPTDNLALNKFLTGSTGHNGFNKCVKDGLSITADENGGTKCTYTLLDMVYKAATANTTTNNDTSIAWALAEMLTELTPELLSASEYGNLTKAESYFIEASTYGGVPDIITSNPTNAKDVYYRRLYGAIEYATLRHNKFCEITEMAKKARTELTNKGVTNATLINAPKNPDGTFNFPRGSLLNPTKLAPKVTSREYPSGSTFDANSMTSVMDTMDTVDKVKHYYGDAPFLNKTFCAKRYYDIMIGHPSSGIYDNKFLTLFNNATDPQDAILNVIKRGIDGSEIYQPQYRKRPTNATVSWYPTTLTCLSDCDVEKVSWAICKEQPESEYPCGDDCDQFEPGGSDNIGSYPSGHAGKSYIAGLAYLEASGINKMSDMKGFGDHRELVRAHWKSDIVVAQVVASTTIGYLNGISEFLSEIKSDFITCSDTPEPTPTPTDCYCDASGNYNNIGNMYGKEGSRGVAVLVGYIDLARGCTSLTPKCTSIICRENTCADESEVIASTSDVTFQENYEGHDWGVFAIIKENTQGSMRRVRIYFNCLNTSESADPGELNYINFFQAG